MADCQNNQHLDRKKRLYNPAPEGTLSVRDFIKSHATDGWVAGRLTVVFHSAGSALSETGWKLSGDGEILEGKWKFLEGSRRQLDELASIGPTAPVIAALRVFKLRNWQCDDLCLLTGSSESENFWPGLRPFSEVQVLDLRKFMKFRQSLGAFFLNQDFLEIKTPTLVASPGLEPHLDPFQTNFIQGKISRSLYLPTSPEFHLKKTLVRGLTRVYEIKECFRNGEVSAHHEPEFTMLEWYRAFAPLTSLIDDVKGLIGALGLRPDFRVMTMAELWNKQLGFELTPGTTVEELENCAKTQQVHVAQDDDFDDIFHRIMLQCIEPSMKASGALFVTHFPPSQAALARLTADGWADRFEFYWNGLEIANAFHELNDPVEQQLRFKQDQKRKAELQKTIVPVDEEFLKGLQVGMPPASGIALGVDRLFMAIHSIQTIAETRAFPFYFKLD